MSACSRIPACVAAVTAPSDSDIAAAILDRVAARGAGKSICPSEVARGLSEDWRDLMPEVRRVAGVLSRDGQVRVTQKGTPIDPELARGPIRLSLPE
ncbi:MAG: DUF3253 domain-containing protein [Pseudomonadota bacterium]